MDKATLKKLHPMLGLIFYLFIISTLIVNICAYISPSIAGSINYYVAMIWHSVYGTIVLLLALVFHVIVTHKMVD